jgi:hypothetical protein
MASAEVVDARPEAGHDEERLEGRRETSRKTSDASRRPSHDPRHISGAKASLLEGTRPASHYGA